MHNLLNSVSLAVVEAPAAAAQTELTTDTVDVAGHTGVMFIAQLGDVISGCVLGFAVDHSDDGLTWVGPIWAGPLASGLTHTAGASDADNKLMVLDVVRPERRYVRARLQRTVANAVCNGILAIKYGAPNKPVVQGSAVLKSATLANPSLT